MRPIPDRAVAFVGQLEGCVLKAYPDPATKGEPFTIGYGHTAPDVKLGQTITQTQATNYLRADLATARARLFAKIGDVMDELSEPQFCALLSFVLNLGAGDWRIWKLLKARQFDQVPVELMRFCRAAGKVNKGLVNRRTAECNLWAEGAASEPLPSSVTRVMDTPPTPAASTAKPLSQSKSFMTAGLTAAAGLINLATGGVKQITDTIAPFVGSSEKVANLHSSLNMLLAGLAVATLVFVWLKNRKGKA